MVAFGAHPPNVLGIHLGGNDLAKLGGKALILDVIRDRRKLNAKHPAMHIIWLAVILRMVWWDEQQVQCINTARRCVNREVCRAEHNGLGSVIGYPEFQVNRPELFQRDGVHLSDMGLEIFLKNLYGGGLLLELEELCGGHGI